MEGEANQTQSCPKCGKKPERVRLSVSPFLFVVCEACKFADYSIRDEHAVELWNGDAEINDIQTLKWGYKTYCWNKKDAELAALRAELADAQAARLMAEGELEQARAVAFHAYVKGAKDGYFKAAGATAWNSEVHEFEAEAQRWYPYAPHPAVAQQMALDINSSALRRSRRTIAALVVAFRIVWYCVVNEYPRALPTIKRLMAERQRAKQAGEA